MKQKTIRTITYVLMGVTAVGVTVTGILTRIPFIKILPLYISIVILMLQSRVSRVAYLLGACNAVLYAAVDFSYGLYASAVYDVLFSSTIQLFTFFHWKKRAYGSSVRLKKMTAKERALCAAGFAVAAGGVIAVLTAVDSSYRIFDTLQSLLGIAVSILTAFAFVEYGPLQLCSITVSVTMNAVMLAQHPERLPFLIYASYSFICVVFALFRIVSLWNEQKGKNMNIKTVFDLPHTAECARNGEGSFLYTAGGDILYAYSEFHTADPGDGAPSNIALLRSEDEGEHWKYEGHIAEARRDFGVSNVMCVSSARLSDGAVAFFFLIKENDGTSTMGRTVSRDDGRTFRAERCVFLAEPAYYVLENDRVVRLSDGRLATALSRHDAAFTQASVVTFVSDDDGKTFRSAAEGGLRGETVAENSWEEPGLLERPDGSVLVWGRTFLGSQYTALSTDGLKTISEPKPSRFTSPRSPMILKREASGRCYAVYNPEPGDPQGYLAFQRTPLVLEISLDGGFTWQDRTEIGSDRNTVYMYPATFETKAGDLLVSFMYKKKEETEKLDLSMMIWKIRFR